MLAMNFRAPFRIRADRNRPDPEIKHPYDTIVRVTRSLICGSDLVYFPSASLKKPLHIMCRQG